MEIFNKKLESVAQRHGYSETLRAFLAILVNFFADGHFREDRDLYVGPLIASKDALNEAFGLFFQEYALELNSSSREWIDPLGELYEDWNGKGKRDGLGQFFTPPPICDLLSRISVSATSTGQMLEPAAGSGRIILSAHATAPALEFIAIEKDYLLFLMSAVNMYLNGCIGKVIWGDTIHMELWKGLEIVRTPGPLAQVVPLVIVPFTPTPTTLATASERGALRFDYADLANIDSDEPTPPLPRPIPAPRPAPALASPDEPKPRGKPTQLSMF